VLIPLFIIIFSDIYWEGGESRGIFTGKRMSKASYVCVVCSQDFTRKWSREIHNKHLHFGMAEIVLVLDYIIGRLSGKYFQADPLEHRTLLKNRGNKNHPGLDYHCELTEKSRKEKEMSKDKESLFQEEDLADLRLISLNSNKIGIVVIYSKLLDTEENLKDQPTKILKQLGKKS